eukprot:COSAG05_NODE_314_length_11610_cov_17.223265_12_plen_126_part_00
MLPRFFPFFLRSAAVCGPPTTPCVVQQPYYAFARARVPKSTPTNEGRNLGDRTSTAAPGRGRQLCAPPYRRARRYVAPVRRAILPPPLYRGRRFPAAFTALPPKQQGQCAQPARYTRESNRLPYV